jgi:hypothetical protein
MITQSQLKVILARDHGRLSKVLAVLSASGKPTKIQDINRISAQAGFRKMRDWNVSSILANSRGKAILLPDGWEITETGEADVAVLAGQAQVNAPPPASDLRTETANIKDVTTRAFAEEAVAAYEAKLYRSAIVMSWLTALDVLYQAVLDTKLGEFNAEATRVTQGKWRPATGRDGLSLMKEVDFLDRIHAIGLIGKNVKATLNECLTRRNGCGHPNSLKVKDRAVAHHVEALILNVFQKFGAPAP